jgi:hypothetical protein
MAHIQNHTKKWLRNIKISTFFLSSSEKSMLSKSDFSQLKPRKWPISQGVGIQNFEFIYEVQVMVHIRTTQNITWKHKNFTIFLLSSEKSMLRKRVFSQRKGRKWQISQDVGILKFCGYFWRTSDGSHPESQKSRLRNIKISPFFLLYSEISMLKKRVFSQRKRRKWPISQDVWIPNFESIYEEQVMARVQNHTKHDFEI